MDLNHVAPCGIDCVNCELFAERGLTEHWARVAAKLGKKPEEVACPGCRATSANKPEPGCVMHAGCETLACVSGRGHVFCHECADFPCVRLQPLAEGAAVYPHNLKAFNLAMIKARGVEAFLSEAPKLRALYYKGKFKIGAGPQEA